MRQFHVVPSCNLTFLECYCIKISNFLHISRPKWEGGQYEGDENSRMDALRLAMELGADYVDIELKVVFLSMNLKRES